MCAFNYAMPYLNTEGQFLFAVEKFHLKPMKHQTINIGGNCSFSNNTQEDCVSVVSVNH